MADYKIEKDVPLPSRAKPFDYPLAQMAIGDSFAFALIGEYTKGGRDKAAAKIQSQINRFRQTNPEHKFKVMQFKEKNEGRCWRIK